jgi:hypothetical protein
LNKNKRQVRILTATIEPNRTFRIIPPIFLEVPATLYRENNVLNLTIQHLIHLTREQRYALHEGIEIVTVGICVPVWFVNKMTSEPAREVFCNYYIQNPKADHPIKVRGDGFEITLPYREGKGLSLTDDEWRILHNQNPEKLERLYKQCVAEVSSKNLLDIGDGGNGGHLCYREHNKIQEDGQTLNMMHYIQISPIEDLTASIS